jgi:hypothetical protein
MDNIAGPPVEDANFFGREAAVAALWRDLEHHDILLLGPRRIGKTSAARAVLKLARSHQWRALEVNVASCLDERAFVEKLTREVAEEARSRAGKAFDAVKSGIAGLLDRVKSIRLPGDTGVELGAADAEDWTLVASDALRLLSRGDQKWLVYVDELPIMLLTLIRDDAKTGVQRVRRFLDWFRNDVRAMPECKHVRWLITGSVGLDTLVQRHRMADTVNTFKHEGLRPFDTATALSMLEALAKRYALDLTPADGQRILEEIHWPQPYYLQRTFNNLLELVGTSGLPPGPFVDAAVARLIDEDEDNDFHHWEARLTLQLETDDAAHAIHLLTLAAEKREGAQPEYLLARLADRMGDATDDAQRQRFIELRDVLVRDAYWWADNSTGVKRYRFHLEPLRRWWLRRHTL